MMAWGILVLLAAQVCGDLIAQGLHLPLPGTVLGIGILVFMLRFRPSLAVELEKTSSLLLKNFALFLIPIGVSLLTMGVLLRNTGPQIFVVLLIASLLTIASTVLTFVWIRRALPSKRPAAVT
jgi:holin-like protein